MVNAGREGVTTAIVKGGVAAAASDGGSWGRQERCASGGCRPSGCSAETPAETSIAAIAARMAAAGSQAPVREPEVIAGAQCGCSDERGGAGGERGGSVL